jgi:hypothetical protein
MARLISIALLLGVALWAVEAIGAIDGNGFGASVCAGPVTALGIIQAIVAAPGVGVAGFATFRAFQWADSGHRDRSLGRALAVTMCIVVAWTPLFLLALSGPSTCVET